MSQEGCNMAATTSASLSSSVCLLLLAAGPSAAETKLVLELDLQPRGAKAGTPPVRKKKVPASKTAILVVDMWDYHWCATWCGRAAAMIPRMNASLAVAR